MNHSESCSTLRCVLPCRMQVPPQVWLIVCLTGCPADWASPFVLWLVRLAIDAPLYVVILSGFWLIKPVICGIHVLVVSFFSFTTKYQKGSHKRDVVKCVSAAFLLHSGIDSLTVLAQGVQEFKRSLFKAVLSVPVREVGRHPRAGSDNGAVGGGVRSRWQAVLTTNSRGHPRPRTHHPAVITWSTPAASKTGTQYSPDFT